MIYVTAGNINIGTVTGNVIGGGAAAYDTINLSYDNQAIYSTSAGTVNIENNTIGNIRYYKVSPGGDRTLGIYVTGAGAHSIKNNIIRDLSSNSSGTGFTYLPVGIYLSSSGNGHNVEGNQIYNISQTNAGTSAYTVVGIYVASVSSSPLATHIRRNRIYNITAVGTGTGTSSPQIWGIYAVSGSATYSNNMISLGYGVSNEVRIYGIQDLGTGTNYWYYNSVSVTGAIVSGSNNSYAFCRSGTAYDTLRNNIFANFRYGGTGFHVAIANTNASATGWPAGASDYNVLYNMDSTCLAQWLGSAASNNRTLGGWQAPQNGLPPGSGGDANSINADPRFISTTDLHVFPDSSVPSNNGTPITGITVDFDGEPRSVTTPDRGADEYTAMPPQAFNLLTPTNGQINVPINGTLTWEAAQYAGKYYVYLGTSSPPPIYDSVFVVSYNYSLSPLVTYYWNIVAKNGTGTTNSTNGPFSFTTAALPPAAPTNLVLSNIQTTSMDLAWTDNANNEDSFRVYRRIYGAPSFNIIADLPPSPGTGGTVNYSDGGPLTPNTHYEYNVRAYHIIQGVSDPAAADTWTLAQTPGAPTFSDVAYRTMTVYLTPLTNPASTEFVVRVTYAGPTTRYLDPVTGTLVVSEVWGTYAQFGGASGKLVTGLTPNTQYTFETKARNGATPPVETPYGPAGVQSTLVPISTFPYFQDFEYADKGAENTSKVETQPTDMPNPNYWTTGIFSGTANDWVRGTPAKIQILGPHSGTKCWVTALTGYYQNSENAYVLSPAFDFSGLIQMPKLSFWHNFYTETGWEGCIVEYTTDDVNWTKLDTSTLYAVKWYNNTSSSGPIPPMKWSGTSTIWPDHQNGWVQSSRMLDTLVGQPYVRFRLRFGSDGSVNSYDGWAFDDFAIDPFTDASVTTISRPNLTEQKRVSFQPQVTVTNSGSNTDTIPTVAEIWLPQSGLSEGFESTTFPPTGWIQQIIVSGGTNWTRVTSGSYPVLHTAASGWHSIIHIVHRVVVMLV